MNMMVMSERTDRHIERVYGQHCAGMQQLDVLSIPMLFDQARMLIEQGITDDELGAWMVEFVKKGTVKQSAARRNPAFSRHPGSRARVRRQLVGPRARAVQ